MTILKTPLAGSFPSQIQIQAKMIILQLCLFQGDKEVELGLPFSPLCDRKATMIAQSQIGKIGIGKNNIHPNTQWTQNTVN